MTDHHDHDIIIIIIIIGAGLSGLSAAHTFLTIDPSLSLLIIDSKPSIGGVWSTEQIYPGLRTNSVGGFFEFSDYPILKAGVGVEPRCHIEGWQMRDYLVGFAERFGVKGFVRLGVDVVRAVEVEGGDGGWEVEVRSGEERRRSCIRSKKLVLATGTHSSPYKPPIKGISSSARPVVHTHDLGRTARSLIDNTSIKKVTVIGGAKSAHDAVYMFARAGKHIDWILPGRGAVPMAKPSSKLGFWTMFVEAVLMFRPITWFGPAPWSEGDGFGWIRRFLHGTRLGNFLVRTYWMGLHEQSLRESGILESEKVRCLVPSETPMFYGTQLSALNYETNFYDLFLDESVSLVEGRLDFVSNGQIHMKDGVILDSDAIILATGYDSSACIPLEPASRNLSRGCPVNQSKYRDTIYPDLDVESDKQILHDFPLLAHSPSKPDRSPSFTAWRQWRFLAPPSQINHGSSGRNLVFLNAIASLQTCIKCELTSLWTYAYLYDRLTVPTAAEIDARREISLGTRFNRLRAALDMQGKQADVLLDGLPYYDLLLRDLGLRSWRKGWGWIGEVFWGVYTARDYRGVVQEWMAVPYDVDKGGRKKMS